MNTDKQPSPTPQIDAEPWRIDDGPVLLLAGPGTGKTHQLGLRIKYLIDQKVVPPENVTVITFTREAAENMRQRIADEEKKDVYLEPEKRPAAIMTMHSLGLEIVRPNYEKLGLPEDFKVLTNSLLRRIIFRDAALRIGATEADGKAADTCRQKCETPEAESVEAQVIVEYERILRSNGAMDYDDQITLACKILREHEAIRSVVSTRASHLLVDEYQDINAGQHALIKLLAGDHPSGMFVVGDDDQSIYSFRGGMPRYIREFEKDFGPEVKVRGLALSRRCPDTVLLAALSVIAANDANRLGKPAPEFDKKTANGSKVRVHNVATDLQEAQTIAAIASKALPKKTVLVLIPAKQYAEPVKQALRRRGIASEFPPSLDDSGFVLLDTLYEWLQNPNDSFALRLCIEAICEGGTLDIPSKRVRKAAQVSARQEKLRMVANLWADVIEKGISLWEALQARAKSEGGLFADLLQRLKALQECPPKDVHEFLSRAAENLHPWVSLDSFMAEVRSWLGELRAHGKGPASSVRIMTYQAAKGLEADVVCVVGLNEGILPRQDAMAEKLEEAARLTYVSMTRAKEELHLFHARKRDASITFLNESFQLDPSRFIGAITAEHREDQYHQAPSKAKKVATKRGVRRSAAS